MRTRFLGHTKKVMAGDYRSNRLTSGEARLGMQTRPVEEKSPESLIEYQIILKALRTW